MFKNTEKKSTNYIPILLIIETLSFFMSRIKHI